MRTILVSFAAILYVALAGSSQAERQMFIIANDADGYGIDRCLASGAACGKAAATAYCKTKRFDTAASFRKVDRDDITGTVPAGGNGGCGGRDCAEFVAIVCTR